MKNEMKQFQSCWCYINNFITHFMLLLSKRCKFFLQCVCKDTQEGILGQRRKKNIFCLTKESFILLTWKLIFSVPVNVIHST